MASREWRPGQRPLLAADRSGQGKDGWGCCLEAGGCGPPTTMSGRRPQTLLRVDEWNPQLRAATEGLEDPRPGGLPPQQTRPEPYQHSQIASKLPVGALALPRPGSKAAQASPIPAEPWAASVFRAHLGSHSQTQPPPCGGWDLAICMKELPCRSLLNPSACTAPSQLLLLRPCLTLLRPFSGSAHSHLSLLPHVHPTASVAWLPSQVPAGPTAPHVP
ncbi:uncharacterized protein LOC129032141 [Pongo pygmaeus]|uniref:uncharacterized protein LOC129032141 n=1 Tax=Pongo pygmaeus TaxID=9600 RepID=UPI0023E1F629|nr:uncharacterized protein LOC129032141 [Pongo pygmaeus]